MFAILLGIAGLLAVLAAMMGGIPSAPRAVATLQQPDRIYGPTGRQLMWFWLAGPLTCLIFVPLLFAGVFGAPVMPLGMIAAWALLRRGRDDFWSFGLAGFVAGLSALLVASLVNLEFASIFVLGLFFGPLMAMTFRGFSGRWREFEGGSETQKAA